MTQELMSTFIMPFNTPIFIFMKFYYSDFDFYLVTKIVILI